VNGQIDRQLNNRKAMIESLSSRNAMKNVSQSVLLFYVLWFVVRLQRFAESTVTNTLSIAEVLSIDRTSRR
jgi:hypothetical protein